MRNKRLSASDCGFGRLTGCMSQLERRAVSGSRGGGRQYQQARGPIKRMNEGNYTVTFAVPHNLTNGDDTELSILGYDDFGSMYEFELTDGSTRSVGKQLVADIVPIDG